MRQQTGRQKFQSLRLMTFQDWIIPHYNSSLQNTVSEMSKNSMPVFSYTKMETGPPLSTINSQFAWAGHVLPDLVQEQSDRLLRRLERPRTAGGRTTIARNDHIKGKKITRPSTAFSNVVQNANSDHISEKQVGQDVANNNTTQSEAKCKESCVEQDKMDEASLGSERSSSPDFIANLYKEYEEKIAADHKNHVLSDIDSPIRPSSKLLRRPNIQFKRDEKNIRHRSNSDQATQCNKTISCVVKLPTEKHEPQPIKSKDCKKNDLRSKSEPPRFETWLDLSELCQSSDDETDLRRSSLTNEKSANSKLLDLIERGERKIKDDACNIAKTKPARPCSSKMSRKSRPKSKHKRHRSSVVEESTKEYRKEIGRKSSIASCQRVKSSDKLREEIETQMSKLDFDTQFGLPKPRNMTDKVLANKDISPKNKPRSWSAYSTSSSTPRSIPLKKIPIQILSDPFTSNLKVYQNDTKWVQNGVGS